MLNLSAGLLALWFCPACTTNEKLMVRPWLPVVTTLDLQRSPQTAPIGKLVAVAGVITAANPATNVVRLDNNVECVVTAAEGMALDNLMNTYAQNIGAAAALRGRLARSKNPSFGYLLKPSGQRVMERGEARQQIEKVGGRRPVFRFASYYGW